VADRDAAEAAEADKDHDSHPGTEPFVPDFDMADFDTGEPSVPFVPDFDDDSEPFSVPGLRLEPEEKKAEPEPPAPQAASAQDSATETPVAPVTVPGRYQYLKWWQLVLVVLGVWLAAAQVGLGLLYWWFHSIDKTLPVYVVLVYVVACWVAGVLLAMVQGRALITALSLAVMSGPFASLAAAAPLYGHYYCERTGHCLLVVIPW
jgi:hypothetical protein